MTFNSETHVMVVCGPVPLRWDGTQAVLSIAEGLGETSPVQPLRWTNPAARAEANRSLLDDDGDDRQTVILAGKSEYADNPKVTSGNRLDSWVNQTLRDKNMTLLSDAEKKALIG